jgi:predicted outer membrane protein
MRKKKIKSYKKFGSIIAEYKKFPEQILELAKKETLELETKETIEPAQNQTLEPIKRETEK